MPFFNIPTPIHTQKRKKWYSIFILLLFSQKKWNRWWNTNFFNYYIQSSKMHPVFLLSHTFSSCLFLVLYQFNLTFRCRLGSVKFDSRRRRRRQHCRHHFRFQFIFHFEDDEDDDDGRQCKTLFRKWSQRMNVWMKERTKGRK